MKPPIIATIEWRSITLTVRHVIDWGAGFDHIEITSEDRMPFPISETGYRSHFLPTDAVHPYGTAQAYVEAWLDEAAGADWWNAKARESTQLSLF